MRIAFLDGHCPDPYAPPDLRLRALGGTEASVLHLAEGLAGQGAEVVVHQHNRAVPERHAALYAPWRDPAEVRADAVVVVNAAKLALRAARRGAPRVVVWRHNFIGARAAAMGPALAGAGVAVICVSRFHAEHTAARMAAKAPAVPRIGVIPNPVVIHAPPGSGHDPNRLIFASSPHKRIEQCLARFQAVRALLPELRLAICNPGYKPDADLEGAGIEVLGALPRPRLHAEMAGALALFHAQDFPETFGLVFAEAHALGTPVIAPPVAAAPEVIADPRQCAALDPPEALAARIAGWQQGARPKVALRPDFALEAVVARWRASLSDVGA